MIILSLDLGRHTGWAIGSLDGECRASGTIEFRNSRFEGGGMVWLRFRSWLDKISHLVAPDRIDMIAFEEVRRHLGTDAAHCYGGYLATLTAWCELNKAPYNGIPVGMIKRHITGKGNANKQAVIDAVRALGFSPGDDNEADALALLHFIQHEYIYKEKSDDISDRVTRHKA